MPKDGENDNIIHSDTECMRDVPIGNDDFMSIRDDDGYYVDKTKLIEDILGSRNTKVFLFTRPRRFGKTLNLSMLDAFFNLEYKGKAEKWFAGLKVSERKDLMAVANQDPVIFISLKDLDTKDFGQFLRDYSAKFQEVCLGFEYLRKWDTDSELKEKFELLYRGKADLAGLKRSIRDLSMALEAFHGRKVIVLIDEYDNPINGSYGRAVQEDILDFMKGLMSNSLKTNKSLRFGVVTGVMQIAKESIFSGINNLYVDNVLSTEFDEEYGFTENEVKEMLSYYGHPEKMDEVKEWYDGYRFGDADIYNPWSLLNYISRNFTPAPYWAGTSGNDILDTLVENADENTWQELIDLGNGCTISHYIEPTITMDDIGEGGESIYSVLVMSGYLNAIESDGLYDLSIPNNEMRGVYLKFLSKGMGTGADVYFRRVFDAMREGDVGNVETTLFDLLAKKIPFFAISKESDYQKILAVAAMCTQGKYVTTMEEESGNGRVDIKMVSKTSKYPHIVMELKKTDSNDPDIWSKEADDAIAQIREKKYHHGLSGKVLLYGICFHGKEVKVIMEEA